MSLPITKSLILLALISATLLIHVGGALAADSVGDVQQQMRELLAGKAAHPLAPASERGDERAMRPPVDAQEFARRLLLGATASRVANSDVVTRSVNAVTPRESPTQVGLMVHDDPQIIVQRLLLGQRSVCVRILTCVSRQSFAPFGECAGGSSC